ncbi:hypothetical protein [Actinoplanes sp. NPDC049265]|uniref:hypothetical protein n=1 Tax=Actinoplanes sp. NPDC049265 TaxID=3363902 RepID=UPI00371180D4
MTGERPDPVNIQAAVSGSDGKERALEVWLWRAERAGWAVTVQSRAVSEPGDVCAVVLVEGLRYRIRHSPRLRRRMGYVEVPAGEHFAATVARMTMGEPAPVEYVWEFQHAAWAEPVIADGW